ncbi:MAG: DUF4982 domain-containing protein [Clostridia bacterium]|nr:DUF4982 domain-containing protein [Clostridia bacterium]
MERLFNDGWLFAKTANECIPDETDFAPVCLPHDWLIGQAENLYECSDGWYRRMLRVDKAADGYKRVLRFDGVYMNCDVLVNGQKACSHRYGYTAFDADLTPFLYDGENEIMVHVRFVSPCSRWYSGAGIYRDVTLHTLPQTHIVPDGVYVYSEHTADGWMLHVSAEVCGSGEVTHRLFDAQGCMAAQGKGAQCALQVPDAKPWSCQTPYLYTLETAVGEHTVRQRVGLRTVRFTPDAGLFVNDEPVKVHGVCLHHDLGALGAAFHEPAARRQLRVMQQMGANALRTAHNPPARQVLDLCDEMGILVMNEAFDMWRHSKNTYDYARFFEECEEMDIASWVRRDRNHPSLILWSIGNEILDTHVDADGPEVTHRLAQQVYQHDPAHNGAVTLGLNYMPWEGAQRCVDVIKNGGYNYAEKLYESHHAKYPDWVIYGSETASLVSSRGVYHFPADTPILSDVDLQCSALGNSLTSWGTKDICRLIVDDLNTPYSMGQFLWSGIDYIGEPTPYHTRGSYFGYADTACFPKDLYYLFQSMWTAAPMAHIGVHWDWNPGQLIDVNVMTNGAACELFLNGRSLGCKAVTRTAEGCLPRWRVPYEAGVLRAVAYDADGQPIAEAERHSFGDSRRIVLKAEQTVLKADGRDMAFVEISTVDENGHPVENAIDRMQVTVSGCGVLMGLDNGDASETDQYRGTSMRLFGGRLLAMIGTLTQAGEICVKVTSPGLENAELVLKAEAAEVKEGVGARQSCPDTHVEQPHHVRRIELLPEDSTKLNADHREVAFRWRCLPEDAMPQPIQWQITNAATIADGCAQLEVQDDRVIVRAAGDGVNYLRAMCANGADHPRILSHMEVTMTGLGTPNRDPYDFVTAGLYDFSSGEISPGNDKGIAFARDGRSMAGFERVDFGPDGSDEITLPIFALDSNFYELEMYLGNPDEGGELIAKLPYQKPSKWNVYQPETYRLPKRLTGIQTISFAMEKKIHLRGFSFTRQSRAWLPQRALDADLVYGDSFTRTEEGIENIGNNVSLVFERMDFGDAAQAQLVIDGATALDNNPITIRIQNADGAEVNEIADFRRGSGPQRFRIQTPGGNCTVTFVFLPGSQFDFRGFRFEK